MTFAVGEGKALELADVDEAETTVLNTLLVLVIVLVPVLVLVRTTVESAGEVEFKEAELAEGMVVCAAARAARASVAAPGRDSSIV